MNYFFRGIIRDVIDLSSDEKIREEDSINFSFDPNDLKAYDSATGEVADTAFNPDDITDIYIAPYNPNGSFPKS